MVIKGNENGTKHPGPIISRVAPHKKVFGEKYNWARRTPKSVKIESYKSRF